jgi:hypothetical protein
MSTTCTLSGTSILVSKTSCYGLQRVPVVLQRNLPLVANTEDPTRFLPDAALTLEPLFPNQASRRQNFVSLTKTASHPVYLRLQPRHLSRGTRGVVTIY